MRRSAWVGFGIGTLGIVALQVFLNGRGPQAAESAGGWLVDGLKRLISPNVAGVPNRRKTVASAPTTPGGGTVWKESV